jgi:hypothetical protein
VGFYEGQHQPQAGDKTMTNPVVNPRIVVLNELTLGYLIDGSSSMGVLAAKIGGHDWKNGPVAIVPGIDSFRPATLADFKAFRVYPRGYLDVT